MNRPLTGSDLSELERLLAASGAGGPEDVRRAAEDAQGLGLLVRSLVGMDRAATKEALARFTNEKTLTANQLEFVNLIVDHLTEYGVVEPARLYESPFTDITPRGPDSLFQAAEIDEMCPDTRRSPRDGGGRMMEKYDVVDLDRPAGGGEYPTQDGFGWTNGVALALAAEANVARILELKRPTSASAAASTGRSVSTAGMPLRVVVVARLEDHDDVAADQVDETVFFADAPRPTPREDVP